MTTTTTYSPGDRVRVVQAGPFLGCTGAFLFDDGDDFLSARVRLDGGLDDGGEVWFDLEELEPLPDPTDPTSTPDDPDRPVGEVIDVVPGALVRQPAGSRRPDPADAASSSQAGLATHVPLRRTPSTADLMADHHAQALAMTEAAVAPSREQSDRLWAAVAEKRTEAEEAADRPALTAYEDGHAQGHRDGLTAALRIVERYEARAADQARDADAAMFAEVRDAIRAEVRP